MTRATGNDARATPPYTIRIPRARFVRFLFIVVAVLLADHVILQTLHYRWGRGHWVLRNLFDVDVEENFPTWYSTAALAVTAALLYAISLRKRADQEPFARHWWGLSIGFLVLSIDEIAGMHEALNTVTDISWTVPAAVLVTIVALLCLRFLFHLPAKTRWGVVLAGGLFVGGAVLVEHATDWYLEAHDFDTLGYNLLTALEEGLEMLGVVVMIHVLLAYMGGAADEVTVGLVVEQYQDDLPAEMNAP